MQEKNDNAHFDIARTQVHSLVLISLSTNTLFPSPPLYYSHLTILFQATITRKSLMHEHFLKPLLYS